MIYALAYLLNDSSWSNTTASGYCERVRDSWIREPTNTISNLAFVFVGMYILWLAQYDPVDGKPSLSNRSWFLTLYAISCVAVEWVVLLCMASTQMGRLVRCNWNDNVYFNACFL